MSFSEKPGRYDPKNGVGFNWSDQVVTGLKSGYRMSRTPNPKNGPGSKSEAPKLQVAQTSVCAPAFALH